MNHFEYRILSSKYMFDYKHIIVSTSVRVYVYVHIVYYIEYIYIVGIFSTCHYPPLGMLS
jgi:hypothetical protein